jgi:putative ABC transport system substrate-binding protein
MTYLAALALNIATGLVLIAAMGPVAAQAPERIPVVGVLATGTLTSAGIMARDAFERGLKELGWVPGRTIRIEYHYAGGKPERLEELARELARPGRDVIVARATPSIRAMTAATTTIPIVMSAAGHDPVQLGFVDSLAKPGGNVTGLTLLNQELPVKQLQLLKEVLPRLSRAVVLGSRAFPLPAKGREDLESAAQTLGVPLRHVDVPGAADLDQAFSDMARTPNSGLLVRSDPFVLEPNVERVVALALKYRLPAVYWLPSYTQAGGLMSYGADLAAVHHRSAYFVDRILRGARPADLPVEEPSTFALTVNVKTAQALGLTMPP